MKREEIISSYQDSFLMIRELSISYYLEIVRMRKVNEMALYTFIGSFLFGIFILTLPNHNYQNIIAYTLFGISFTMLVSYFVSKYLIVRNCSASDLSELSHKFLLEKYDRILKKEIGDSKLALELFHLSDNIIYTTNGILDKYRIPKISREKAKIIIKYETKLNPLSWSMCEVDYKILEYNNM